MENRDAFPVEIAALSLSDPDGSPLVTVRVAAVLVATGIAGNGNVPAGLVLK